MRSQNILNNEVSSMVTSITRFLLFFFIIVGAPYLHGAGWPSSLCEATLDPVGSLALLARTKGVTLEQIKASIALVPAGRKRCAYINALPSFSGKEALSPRSALMWAASEGKTEFTRELLAYPETDVNLYDMYGEFGTALLVAAKRGHRETMALLLAHPGIKVNLDDFGGTALTYAAKRGDAEMVTLLLVQPFIDANHDDGSLSTPLIYAAGAGHKAVVVLLLAMRGIDLKHTDIDGQSAESLARRNGHDGIAELLKSTKVKNQYS